MIRDLCLEYIKTSPNSVTRRQLAQLKWAEDLDIKKKKDKWPVNTLKNAKHHYQLEKCKAKAQSNTLPWL